MATAVTLANGDARQTLHWVFKIGSLKKSLNFFCDVLGMKILRHEEFNSGCEATCNGPYARPWSKTMVGYGSEDANFVLELTYNYGVRKYARGDDLRSITLAVTDDALARLRLSDHPHEDGPLGRVLATSPDGHTFVLLPQGTLIAAPRKEPFVAVEIRVASLASARDYYTSVCGMSLFDDHPSARDDGDDVGSGCSSVLVGFDRERQCCLRLVEEEGAGQVDHAKAFGRIAMSTRLGPGPIHEAAVASGAGKVINAPLSLDTPGKATVEVTILADPDGYEICFVGADAFFELAAPQEGGDKVDWDAREEAGAGDNK